MRKFLRYFLYANLILLILIQLLPKNKSNRSGDNHDISIQYVHKVPDSIQKILQTSCYDCHSNHTNYPWYSNIQPINFWLAHHIDEGKRELNFSEFGNYSIRRQYFKLKEIMEQIDEEEMPMKSYTIIHRDATLNSSERNQLIDWSKSLVDSFERVYPTDSLKRRKR